jgi:hypothetical protein
VEEDNRPNKLIKFSRASSRVNWLKIDKTDVSRTISVLVLRETSSRVNWLKMDITDVSRTISVLVLRETAEFY